MGSVNRIFPGWKKIKKKGERIPGEHAPHPVMSWTKKKEAVNDSGK